MHHRCDAPLTWSVPKHFQIIFFKADKELKISYQQFQLMFSFLEQNEPKIQQQTRIVRTWKCLCCVKTGWLSLVLQSICSSIMADTNISGLFTELHCYQIVLQQLNFDVRDILGKENKLSDQLSDHKTTVEVKHVVANFTFPFFSKVFLFGFHSPGRDKEHNK